MTQTLEPAPAFSSPLGLWHITSPFGRRTSPITGQPEGHPGVDLRAPTGTPVYAPADGHVAVSKLSVGNPEKHILAAGEFLCIDHGRDWQTRYMHLDRRLVQAGDEVKAGQLIAYSGHTGATGTGPHLHFEIRRQGVPVDAAQYVVASPVPAEAAKETA